MLHDMSLLRREQLSAALAEEGFRYAVATLTTLASRGGGPPISRRRGQTPFYAWGPALAWAEQRSGQRPWRLPRFLPSKAMSTR
jgi:hypothetical protein